MYVVGTTATIYVTPTANIPSKYIPLYNGFRFGSDKVQECLNLVLILSEPVQAFFLTCSRCGQRLALSKSYPNLQPPLSS